MRELVSRLISLVDAYRMVLRPACTERPAFVDEISPQHFRFPKSMGATEAEMQAAEAARKTLWNAFLQQRIRLRGHLEGNLPADIDPLEMRQGGIKIFEGILEVYGERGRTLRTYHNVHCYEDEIKELLPSHSTRRGRKARIDWDAIELALSHKVERCGFPSSDNDEPDWRMQADAERWAAQLLQDREETVGESWLREKVSGMLARIKAGN